MDSNILIQYLSAVLYGDATSFLEQSTEEQCRKLEQDAEKDHLEMFLYWSLGDKASKVFSQFQSAYFLRSAFCVMDQMDFQSLYDLLEKEKIRFVPIKGIDLAYRVYPVPEIRYYFDWDILFHPDDCAHALCVLKNSGWKNLAPFDEKERPAIHHYPVHQKGSIYLEPHWTLPKFQDVDPNTLWEYIHPVKEGSFWHILSPELNLLMLTRHFTELFYTHVSMARLLLDVAFQLKSNPVDWKALKQLSRQFHMPYPGNFLAAFDDFFPQDVISHMEADPDVVGIYKKIFELQSSMAKYNTKELEVNNFSFDSGSSWISRRIRAFAPDRIRHNYRLPLTGSYCKLACCYVLACFRKIGEFFRYIRKINPRMRYFNRLIRQIESYETSR